ALQMATLTLEKMAAGGIHDQVGGGFHRYATDARWLVPHFEKMLYDNAQLAVIYIEGYQATGRADFARVSRETLDYLIREMRAPGGGFYSATDADSEGIEGKFFIWRVDEIDALLDPKAAALVKAYYGMTPGGNFEHANILHVAATLEEAARAAGVKIADARATLDAAREKLYAARLKRVPPLTDTKVIVAWNALAVSAFARGALVLDEPRYAAEAKRTGDFILQRMEKDGRLKRIWKDGRAKAAGTLDDYAFLAAGLLDLYEVTWDPKYIAAAKRLSDTLEAHFRDEKSGGYFMTPSDGEALIARQKPAHDGALPSGNSVAALNLLRLAEFTSDDAYRERSDAVVRGASAVLLRGPRSLTKMLSALDFRHDLPKEIVLVKATPEGDAGPLLAELRRAFVPNRVIAVTAGGEAASKLAQTVPLAEGKTAIDGKTTAYVCEREVCALPTSDPEVFAKQIGSVRKYSEVD
ncbi:MAG: thioredoxin domain-containing protein, partial [Myxococcota bacterium]